MPDRAFSHQETIISNVQRDEALQSAANVFPGKGRWWPGLPQRGEPGAGME